MTVIAKNRISRTQPVGPANTDESEAVSEESKPGPEATNLVDSDELPLDAGPETALFW